MIGFTVVISAGLILWGATDGKGMADLAQTTVLLLLLVFAVANISVLVLRKKPVPHPHFQAPLWAPILGAVTTLILASPVTGRPLRIYVVAGVLVGIGAVLWGLNRLVTGRRVDAIDPEKLVK